MHDPSVLSGSPIELESAIQPSDHLHHPSPSTDHEFSSNAASLSPSISGRSGRSFFSLEREDNYSIHTLDSQASCDYRGLPISKVKRRSK